MELKGKFILLKMFLKCIFLQYIIHEFLKKKKKWSSWLLSQCPHLRQWLEPLCNSACPLISFWSFQNAGLVLIYLFCYIFFPKNYHQCNKTFLCFNFNIIQLKIILFSFFFLLVCRIRNDLYWVAILRPCWAHL